jgi:glycerophosphoryl diester phosphodiesterase
MDVRWAGLLKPRGVNPSHDSLDEALLAECHARGQRVAVWTVDDEAGMRRLAAWGVDAIITNRPDVCLNVLRQMSKH